LQKLSGLLFLAHPVQSEQFQLVVSMTLHVYNTQETLSCCWYTQNTPAMKPKAGCDRAKLRNQIKIYIL